MQGPEKPHATPPDSGGDGVRIVRREPPGGRSRRRLGLLTLAITITIAIGVGHLLFSRHGETPETGGGESASHVARVAAAETLRRTATLPRATRRASLQEEPLFDFELHSLDPDDVASYISASDPEPTMAELITALNEVGIYSGLGAFNPPGTSPPLPGLAVPEDYELPEGYVRHHQVTDDGEPIEAILMFSPDFEFYDESGQLVEIPPDRVVPPELAPPDLPLRQVEIPSP